ncbi:meiotic sister chromatid recombination protein ish1 [Ascobolus immersus RN42]|uniref:Meiotic sister chromatid recombination protein ish1 n=1 Tax=Ascobolus immersus RN42 TaxID=1160509 RepID=A0A3N4IGR5_ASCIM|nr:meiotic sister chromatid recombination protein ish1 [Ascobolus immersus RN42]
MKLTQGIVLLAIACSSAQATWGSHPSAYSKWTQDELQRWLADHDITYPEKTDRTALENLIRQNWEQKSYRPYSEWEPAQIQQYLREKGIEIEDKAADNKNWLLDTIKSNWHWTEATVEEAYANVKGWIFDSWTDSQIKTFLDKHNIPNPNPTSREALLAAARENYSAIAKKSSDAANYPGNWLYASWSDSDLKKWLDERGYNVPQPSTRDKLIAAVRRNSYLASQRLSSAQQTLTDEAFDTWSDSQLKATLDKYGFNVPQGSKRNELLALARRHKKKFTDEQHRVSASAASAYGSATSVVGENAAGATDTVKEYGSAAFETAIGAWSNSRLKAFLDSRGVPVPQGSTRDQLLASVRANKSKAQDKYGVWTFQDWSIENIQKWLEEQGHTVSATATTKRDDLVSSAEAALASASSAGGAAYDAITSAFAAATDTAKHSAFDTWSDSELKSYLDSYGVNTYQGNDRNKLLAEVRRQSYLFRNGGKEPTVLDRVQGLLGWVKEKAFGAADSTKQSADEAVKKVKEEL